MMAANGDLGQYIVLLDRYEDVVWWNLVGCCGCAVTEGGQDAFSRVSPCFFARLSFGIEGGG